MIFSDQRSLGMLSVILNIHPKFYVGLQTSNISFYEFLKYNNSLIIYWKQTTNGNKKKLTLKDFVSYIHIQDDKCDKTAVILL